MSDTLICLQEPHQLPAIVFSAPDLESLYDALTRQYATYEGEIFDELMDSADLIKSDPERLIQLCRDVLAYDMRTASIISESDARQIIRDGGRHAAAISRELE